MLTSMTGFAARAGHVDGYSWSWDLRAVNGKGLDLRMRLPEWLAVLEPELRKTLGARITRGNVTLGLKIVREHSDATALLDEAALDRTLAVLQAIEDRAGSLGVTLTPASAADVMGARGVMDMPVQTGPTEALVEALRADIAPLLDEFMQMRQTEGQALQGAMGAQLDQIAALTADAADLLDSRAKDMHAAYKAALDRIMAATDAVDEARLAQEIAVLTVKNDVTEEIDRLQAHISAARGYLTATEPVGRKLDFLCQEFNREANTLCAKAQHARLTEIGLALKVLIDQMREQVQNVE